MKRENKIKSIINNLDNHVRKVVGAVTTEMLILHSSCVHATTSGHVK